MYSTKQHTKNPAHNFFQITIKLQCTPKTAKQETSKGTDFVNIWQKINIGIFFFRAA